MKPMYIAWLSLSLFAIAYFVGRIMYAPWWAQILLLLSHWLGIVYGTRVNKE